MDEFLPSLMRLTERKQVVCVFDACVGENLGHGNDFRVLGYEKWVR